MMCINTPILYKLHIFLRAANVSKTILCSMKLTFLYAIFLTFLFTFFCFSDLVDHCAEELKWMVIICNCYKWSRHVSVLLGKPTGLGTITFFPCQWMSVKENETPSSSPPTVNSNRMTVLMNFEVTLNKWNTSICATKDNCFLLAQVNKCLFNTKIAQKTGSRGITIWLFQALHFLPPCTACLGCWSATWLLGSPAGWRRVLIWGLNLRH